MIRSIFVAGALLLATGTTLAQTMPKMELSIGMFRIDTEVAADNMARMKGLMFRKNMPQSAGMLFVFPAAQSHCMWMKNTLIPLSVAFIDDAGKIINIEDMAPETEDSHCASAPARYALEMNLGWFKSKNIKPGMQINGIDRAPKSQ
ncbi:MAG: DUF192 domain-containing protein [Rhodocyclaceae bacterium]